MRGDGEHDATSPPSFRAVFWVTVAIAFITGIYRLIAGSVLDTPSESQQATLNWSEYIASASVGAILGLFGGKRLT